MILLLGTTPDDILYIKNRMIMKEKGAVNKDEHFYYVGEYGGKEICMTYTGHSNIMSAVLTSYMIRKFNPYLVISIGSAQSASANLNQGDLFIAERVYIADLDYGNYTTLPLRDTIHMHPYYVSEEVYIKHFELLNSETGNYKLVRGPVISVNNFVKDKAEAEKIIARQENYIEGATVFDTEMGGIVACCKFYGVPWLYLRSVNYEIGKEEQLISFVRKGVEAQPRIGALVEQLFIFLNTSLEESI
ncbi:MAG: 5'-methylthioadenosine/S-adenosylhomocysteine nucleosidase [Tenericutes bacterium ADurb.Bin024]|nr:MAG: 5'-methylthioadenosine/S-adenosylhomocysteine nucleosidase [Tenericutes bacterium ADurb.Bin024]